MRIREFEDLLDVLADRAGSDRKAAATLRISQPAFSEWRCGVSFPNDDQCVKIAESLQIPLELVLSLVRAARTDNDTARTAWLRIASQFKGAVVITAVTIGAGILPAPTAAPIENAGPACVLCKTGRCPIHRRFGRPLGAILSVNAHP